MHRWRTTWLSYLPLVLAATLSRVAADEGPALGVEPVPAPAPAPLLTAGDAATSPADAAYTPVETLEQAWQLALDSSSALRSKRHLIAAGDAATRAATAERHPNLSLAAGYTVRDREPAYLVPPVVATPGFNTLPTAQRDAFGFQTTIELPVYTSGRIGHEIAAASADQRAAELDYETTAANLKLRVAKAYIAILREQHVLGVAIQRETNLRSHLTDTENLLANDQVPHNDLLAAEVAVANASQQRLQSQIRLEICRAEYNRLLERDLDYPVRLAQLSVPGELPSLGSFCQLACEGRPEVARLGAQSRALDQRADAVRAATKPQFELLGQYLFEDNRFRSPEGIAALAFGVEWNALDGARSRHRAEPLATRPPATAVPWRICNRTSIWKSVAHG